MLYKRTRFEEAMGFEAAPKVELDSDFILRDLIPTLSALCNNVEAPETPGGAMEVASLRRRARQIMCLLNEACEDVHIKS
jgi:hypothetical protein